MSGDLRILLVDDTASIRFALRSVLELEPGLELIEEATNGKEAIDKAIDLRPDVVVLDAMMPILDGASAASVLRERLPETIVVGFTSSTEHSERMLAAGAQASVEKADIEALIGLLRSLKPRDK